jgi:hypothetical protein
MGLSCGVCERDTPKLDLVNLSDFDSTRILRVDERLAIDEIEHLGC